ncbi:MAG: hypothetical protein R8K21_05985 [Mariprofundales bacterium]
MLPSPIMMICMGNVCRSPFAEYYMNNLLEKAGKSSDCFSRGLLNIESQPASKQGVEVAKKTFDINMKAHRSHFITDEDLKRAQLILVMTNEQRLQIGRETPTALGKTMLISHFSTGANHQRDIDDPIGQDSSYYSAIYKQIAHGLDAWAQKLKL